MWDFSCMFKSTSGMKIVLLTVWVDFFFFWCWEKKREGENGAFQSLTPVREPQLWLKQEVLVHSGGVRLQKTLFCTLKWRFLKWVRGTKWLWNTTEFKASILYSCFKNLRVKYVFFSVANNVILQPEQRSLKRFVCLLHPGFSVSSVWASLTTLIWKHHNYLNSVVAI